MSWPAPGELLVDVDIPLAYRICERVIERLDGVYCGDTLNAFRDNYFRMLVLNGKLGEVLGNPDDADNPRDPNILEPIRNAQAYYPVNLTNVQEQLLSVIETVHYSVGELLSDILLPQLKDCEWPPIETGFNPSFGDMTRAIKSFTHARVARLLVLRKSMSYSRGGKLPFSTTVVNASAIWQLSVECGGRPPRGQ